MTPTGVHPVDEKLPAPRLAALGLQHVLVMHAGAIAVPLSVGRALKLSPGQVALAEKTIARFGRGFIANMFFYGGAGLRAVHPAAHAVPDLGPPHARDGAGVDPNGDGRAAPQPPGR